MVKKEARFLAISDIHFGKKSAKSLYEQLQSVFISHLKEEADNIDMVFLAGDLFDRVLQLNELAGSYVVKFFNELVNITYTNNIQLRVIKGTLSHDFNQLRVFSDIPYKFHNVRIIESIDVEEIEVKGEKVKILYLPEEYPTNYDDFYKEKLLDVKDNTYDIIIGHGMIDFVAFTGKEDDGENKVLGTPVHKADDLIRVCKGPIIFGHIHDLQEYKNICYCGSFTRLAFDSQEDKGFLDTVFTLGKSKDHEITLIENELAPTYGVINMDDFEDIESKTEMIKEMKSIYDYVKIKASNKADLDILRKMVEGDSSITVQSQNKVKEQLKVDKKYEYILNRQLPLPDTIQRYVSEDLKLDIPLNMVKEIISKNDVSVDKLIELKSV